MKQTQVWRAQLKCPYDYPLGIVNMHLLTIVLLTVWASCAQGQGGTCDFPKIKHGSIYNENRYKQQFPVAIGKSVYYSCEQSFASPEQSVWTRIECTAEGWSPAPQCLRHCILPSVEHGHSNYSQVTHLEGETVKITCDTGYSLPNNQRNITCTERDWSTEPICIPYHSVGNCGPPPSVENGDTTSYQVGEYAPESKVDYQCQAHYVLEGDRTIVCRNGQWSEPPRCLTPCVISEDLLNEHNLVFRWTGERKLYLESGDTVEFDCKRGYRRKPYESFRKICEKGKIIYPTCV